jgi:hypothetical protein
VADPCSCNQTCCEKGTLADDVGLSECRKSRAG